MKKIITVLILLFLSTGCFNYTELNTLGVVEGLGVMKKDDKYYLTTQILNIAKKGKEKSFTYTASGKTIDEAFKNLSNVSSKEILLSHLKILIIEENTLKNDLTNVIDYFARNSKSKMNFYCFSTSDNPKDIFLSFEELESTTSIDIFNTLKISTKINSSTKKVTFESLLSTILQKGKNPVLPNIKLKNNNDKKIPTLDGLISVDRRKNIIKLNNDISTGYNLIINNIDEPILTNKCKNEDNYFSIKIVDSKNNMSFNEKDNLITMNYEITSIIEEMNCNKNIKKESTRKMINKITSHSIKKSIFDAFNFAKKEKNDFLGIGNYIYKNNYKYFDFKKKNWDTTGLNKINLKVKINLKTIKEGNVEKNIKEGAYYE